MTNTLISSYNKEIKRLVKEFNDNSKETGLRAKVRYRHIKRHHNDLDITFIDDFDGFKNSFVTFYTFDSVEMLVKKMNFVKRCLLTDNFCRDFINHKIEKPRY